MYDMLGSSSVHLVDHNTHLRLILTGCAELAARLLKLNGRIVYLIPTSRKWAYLPCQFIHTNLRGSFSDNELPKHPCLKLISVCEQVCFHSLRVVSVLLLRQFLRPGFSRRAVTMTKHRDYVPGVTVSLLC